MILTNKGYFLEPYYFLISEKDGKLELYYSIGNTISESKKKPEKLLFDKKDLEEVKKSIASILKQKKLKTKEQIKKYFEPYQKEIGELVDIDGSLKSSKIPPLNLGIGSKKTTDQTVIAARMTDNPVTRGYRRYYGESQDPDESQVNEVDYSEAFGYEETKDMDGKETYQYLVKKMGMEPDEAKERTKQFGKDPTGKRTDKAPEDVKDKPGFIDRMTLSEIERKKMIKMVEDLLMKKRSGDSELKEKEEKASKIIRKNISALKKMAEKEGMTINQLIKLLKSE